MRVLAATSPRLTLRLRQAAGRRFEFEAAGSWDAALNAILRQPVEIGVFDPALEARPRAHEIERFKVLFPSLPVLLYTHLSPAIAPVLLRLGKAGIHQVLLAGHDDHPKRLAEVLVAEATHTVAHQLSAAVSDLLAPCPGELRWAVETMIREPANVHTVQQLATRARMDRRTCLRWFARAALPPPSVVLMVFRVVYAHRLLQDPGYTVEDVAAKLGYSQARSFAQNAKEVFGMTPSELRVSMTPAEALQFARQRYFPGPEQDIAEVS